jgi:hypothetical protein
MKQNFSQKHEGTRQYGRYRGRWLYSMKVSYTSRGPVAFSCKNGSLPLVFVKWERICKEVE